MECDTIAALSTPPGEGGIGIVRISGPDSLKIALKIFKPKKNIEERQYALNPRHLTYGHIYDEKKNIIDEVLICYMPSPYTYTREDIVEINAHGGAILLKTILNLLISKGARLAEPGEFTKRAYLNGRIDLIQAESILSIISANSLQALKSAQNNLNGLLSEEIQKIIIELNNILSEIEAGLDFISDDLEDEVETYEKLRERVKSITYITDQLQEKSRRGRILQDGLKTVIVGRPNVGKSSLYNYFIGEERAIVTEFPGTTRDLLIENINIKGIQLKIIDTAGIHKKGEKDPIEKIGMNYSKKAIQEADLVLFILDASFGITNEDIWIYKNLLLEKKDELIIIANKIDIGDIINNKDINNIFENDGLIKISIKNKTGLLKLENKIEKYVYSGENFVESFNESLLVLQLRQEDLISRANKFLTNASNAMKENIPLDLIVIDLRIARNIFLELIGENIQEDILDDIFGRFCIGK